MRALWVVMIFFVFCASAQQNTVPLRFQKITTEQGLPHNYVHSVTQDQRGFIWIGTNYGLARYDGYSFKVFVPEANNPHSITHKPVGATFVDSDNNLWLSINSGGINKMNLDTEHFKGYFTDKTKNYFILGDDKRFFEDSEKRLWVITTSGIFLYDKQNDQFVYALSDELFYKKNAVRTHCADDLCGNIWFVSDNNVYRLNKNTFETQSFNAVCTNAEFNSYSVNTLATLEKGKLLLLTYNNNLICYDILKNRSDEFLKNRQNLRDFYVDRKGNIYVLSLNDKLELYVLQNGHYDAKSFSSFELPNADMQNNRFNFVEDNSGKVYISGARGVSIIDRNSWTISHNVTNQTQSNGLIDNSISGLFIDRTENLWLCVNRRGINKADLRQKPFKLYENSINSFSDLNKDKTVASVLEDSKGNLWVGTSKFGVTIYNKDRSKSVRFYLNKAEQILSIFEDINGDILLGTYLSYTYRVSAPDLSDFEDNSIQKFKILQAYNFTSCRKIVADNLSNLWCASGNGLVEWNRNSNEFKNHSEIGDSLNLISAFCRTVYIAKDQVVWSGSNFGGLCKFDKSSQKFKHYLNEPNNSKSIINNTVYAIYEDSDGFLWVGTGQGLEKFNPKGETFERASESGDIFKRSIFCILPDLSGNFWMSSDKGIIKYNTKTKQIESFGQSDGIQYNEYSTTASSMSKTGEFFFGGSVGLVSFYPKNLVPNPLSASPVITNFLLKNRIVSPGDSINGRVLFNKSIYDTKKISLSYKEADFTLEFSALHFAAPDENHYQYKLEGFNSEWINTDARKRYASYTGLPPGEYTFVLRASNNDGLMCSPKDEVRLEITIVPPFWQTIWFKIMAFGVVIILVYLYVKFRFRVLSKLNVRLEQKVKERTSALEEANAVLEESQEEISQQKEEIIAQYEALEEHQKIILEQNNELFVHRNKLESLVEERTRELEKALVKAEESDKLKTSFLTNMSHEIRTPMNAIIGFSSLLISEEAIEKREKYNNIIKTNGNSLMTLINDILDLSRIQAQQVSLFPKKVNLYDLLVRLNETFKIEVVDKNITLKLSISAIDPGYTKMFDEIRLKQVLSNLISNSIKFTSSGSIEFGILEVTDMITFFVKDTGIGISDSVGDSIFNRFYKIEDDKSHLFRGTGLGLAISKSLVVLWNGKIWYESELGKGTTFFFTHPIVDSGIDEPNIIIPESTSLVSLKGLRILIAEDEESNFSLLEGFFEKLEVEITWAKDGAEAIEFAEKNSFDIVLMDIKMPKMNGIEASNEIKKMHPKLPIIAQTAYAFPTEIEKILQSEIDAYIVKPIERDDLFDLIKKHISQI